MIKTFKTVIFLIILAASLSSCSGTKSIVTPATDHQVAVDGTLTGWDLEKSVLDRSEVIDYYATHDNEYIYLYIDVKSPAQNNAMRNSGLIIYISSNKDSRKKTGIAFPAGSFNLLREDPNKYNSMLNDREWLQNPRNLQILELLESEIFDRIMIVEESRAGKDYGFINKDQLQIDGIQIAAGEGRRLMSVEMRVPVDESSFFNLEGNRVWLGFEIDPPDIRINQEDPATANQRDRYGQRRRISEQAGNQMNFRRQMGEYEEWFLLNLTN